MVLKRNQPPFRNLTEADIEQALNDAFRVVLPSFWIWFDQANKGKTQ